MAEQALIQFRADRDLKEEVTDIFASIGLDMSTALRMFLIKARHVRGLPFEAVLPKTELTRKDALSIIEDARKQMTSIPEMTLDEINAEIHAARTERKAHKA